MERFQVTAELLFITELHLTDKQRLPTDNELPRRSNRQPSDAVAVVHRGAAMKAP